MDDSCGTRRVRARGGRAVVAQVLGVLALAGCGGKVGTLLGDQLQHGAGGTPGESGASATGGTVTASGGAGSVLRDTTDDACPCPPRLSAPDAEGTLAYYESVACYCTSNACPSSIGDAVRDLCDQTEALGAGEVVQVVGCGLARARLKGDGFSFDWVFEEEPDVLVGIRLSGDSPSGRCSVQNYRYGELYECQDEYACNHLCGEQSLNLPRCVDTL
jgi:hypothetical protein